MGRTLVITNDFPPRPGGIQTFGYEIVRRFDPESVTVLTSDWEGAAEFDAAQDFKIVRANTQTLVPSKSTLSLAREIVVAENITRVLFGAAAPLGLLASPLRKLGVTNIVGMTQGHETGWAMTPGTRQALRKIGNDTDYLTYISEYTHKKIAKALSPDAAARMRRIVPGVDSTEFSPDNLGSGNQLRAELGWIDRPVIVCVSRLMARKGQDELIRALPKIQQTAPNASLIIVGDGPYRKDLEQLVKKLGLEGFVHLTGKVRQTELSKWYAAGDIFAMPCRTRMGGWDVEGLGIVFLEGSATGLPVIVGDSGGAVDAVVNGETGFLVDGTNTAEIAGRIAYLFANPDVAEGMGEAGRNWVTQEWTWDQSFKKLDGLLSGLDFSD
ncbi:MAG: glycosyltransferase family 4 protein [Actinobacteria bacterium]|nr:glycosyltransferase family 4 protein [Actinomycetota bacterium]